MQKITCVDLGVCDSSPESYNVTLQNDACEWSSNAVSQWLQNNAMWMFCVLCFFPFCDTWMHFGENYTFYRGCCEDLFFFFTNWLIIIVTLFYKIIREKRFKHIVVMKKCKKDDILWKRLSQLRKCTMLVRAMFMKTDHALLFYFHAQHVHATLVRIQMDPFNGSQQH